MILVFAVGMVATIACLVLQVTASVLAARYFGRTARQPLGPNPLRTFFLQFSVLMVVLMLGNVLQMIIWALLYRAVGGLADFETALYFSGVTFTSLGFGDVVLQGRARLLAPLQAANGLMMFGITTALLMAAVQRATGRLTLEQDPAPASRIPGDQAVG